MVVLYSAINIGRVLLAKRNQTLDGLVELVLIVLVASQLASVNVDNVIIWAVVLPVPPAVLVATPELSVSQKLLLMVPPPSNTPKKPPKLRAGPLTVPEL